MREFDLLIGDLEKNLKRFKTDGHIRTPADKEKAKQYIIELEKAIKILKEKNNPRD